MGYIKKEDLNKKLQEDINTMNKDIQILKQSTVIIDSITKQKYKLIVENGKPKLEVIE
ncbi:hypothetical protein G8S49_05970 [Clostridium botulinum C]|uniref:Uncharacterized protein n=1 Tax=Clostridium botulinum C TaxID=36828 RepID=A0A9Q3V817_CLOBO|nr:hypothetical protein [Clostridium botulinum]MCD3194821.1 hypothetical protein [Clostridium botulinum C]MCD3200244.1 hypothetical protein [Clostridium botulinum C]MCD3205689.1 hypothetical protein [Clostridium botulinum C]MCD3207476.1 hypothetical protein [Clostridium botulinum C]MCD3226210.1 hypothetical protein [Clostridium botulinum C]